MKLVTFFISNIRQILRKFSDVSESYVTLDNFGYFPQLFASKYFCMEARFSKVFKTANTIMSAKTILQRPYKVLESSYKVPATFKTTPTVFKGWSTLGYF